MAIAGARVLVTGATGGLGQTIAAELAGRGASLVLSGRRADALEPIAASLGAEPIVADLASRDDVARLAEAAADVDVLVANAALPGSGTLDTYSVEQIDRVLDVNLRAPVVLAHALVPRMLERGRGQLILISSLSGKAATGGTAMYSATKFGLRGFALALRADLRGSGVGVTAVYPGFIREAGMFADTGAKLPPGVSTKAPADVARAVVRAIERNPAEIDVAPLSLRAGTLLAGAAPAAADALARRLGGDDVAAQLASAQRDRR